MTADAFLETANCRIRYRVIGPIDAPWIVMCHGLALDLEDMLALGNRFSARWRVLLWDLPGHGLSRPFPSTFSADLAAEALRDLLEFLDVWRAALLGFSFGGVAAQYLLRTSNERISAFIAYACFAPFSQAPFVHPVLAAVTVKLRYAGKSLDTILKDFAAACTACPENRRLILRAARQLTKAEFNLAVTALLRSFRSDPHFRIGCPTLFVRGDRDSNAAALTASFSALRAISPTLEDVLIPNAGHCAHHDAPDALDAAINAFLRRSL